MGRTDDRRRLELLPGTLYMLILKTLARLGLTHGYGIAQFIKQTTGDVLQVEEDRSTRHCNACSSKHG